MKYLFFSIFICFLSCQQPPKTDPKTPSAELVRTPAEFEKTDAIWLLWPQTEHKTGFINSEVTLELINTILPYATIKLVVPNDSVENAALRQLPKELMKSNRIQLIKLPYAEFWTRDMGPSFIFENGHLAVADFQFNAWGYTDTLDPRARLDEKLDEKIAALYHLQVRSTSVIHEGGDTEVNGKGTLICSEVVELGRNPTMSKQQLEAAFHQTLGVKRVIWLRHGAFEDDSSLRGTLPGPEGKRLFTLLTTDGHVDEVCRWVNDSTVLLAQVDTAVSKTAIDIENFRRMEENYRILQAATDQDGQPIHIIRMPMPELVLDVMTPRDPVYQILNTFKYQDKTKFPQGKPVHVVAATSYLNFIIINGLVLGQSYWKPGLPDIIRQKDLEAKRILQSVFPGKKIVLINALAVNFGGGGIHCITMNQPGL